MLKKPGQEDHLPKLKLRQPIQNIDQLKAWLASNGIDISRWGRGTAKNVENLWDEILSGESRLQENPTLRIIPVTQVIVRRGNNILIEAEQEFVDNRRRARNHPPSEKMKHGEHYIDAAVRCLQEELGLDGQDIEIIPSTYRQIQEEAESLSYPGLWTRYIFHVVEAKVNGLPDSDFWTIETVDNEQEAVKKHFWVWRG